MHGRRNKAFGWALAASIAGTPGIAQARDQVYRLELPATDLPAQLDSLAALTGASIGFDGTLPRVRVSAVHGSLTVKEALRRVLRDTPLIAVRVGPASFRLVRRSPVIPVASDEIAVGDVVVTARKLPQSLSSVPAAVAAYLPEEGPAAGAASGAREVARAIEGLALTNLGGGQDRLFIRAVADSPFAGFSQTTVSVQVDEARVTFDAPEPGLRLIDVDRVEVLKGPQGPLYGTGALGGVYRIVTRRPVLDTATLDTSGGTALTGGNPGESGSAIVNLPLVTDRIAVRGLGYVSVEPGWVNDADGRHDLNRSVTRGGRLAARAATATGWTIDVAGLHQSIHVDDSQYVDRDEDDLTRDLAVREPRASEFSMAQAVAAGPLGALRLTLATAATWQHQADIYDASQSSAALGVATPATYRDARTYKVLDQEVRLNSRSGNPLTWTAGVSYLTASTAASGDLTPSSEQSDPFFRLQRHVTEAAVYADGSSAVARSLRAGLGVRVFRSSVEDERRENDATASAVKALVGVSPSASLAYQPRSGRFAYLRFSTALRAGGLDPENLRSGRYDADMVRSIEAGARFRSDDGAVSVELGLFRTSWTDVQSDYLLPTGLVATRNAGNAAVIGGDVALDWRVRRWLVRGGVALQHGRLVSTPDGTDLPDDRRLPVSPDVTARIEISRSLVARDWSLLPRIAGNLVGPTRLSFDDGLDRAMPGYATLLADVAASRGDVTLRLSIDNVLDTRADTFAFGNPFSIRNTRQFTPLRPRTVSLTASRSF